LDSSFIEDEEEEVDNDNDEDEADFDRRNGTIRVLFGTVAPCYAHTMQLPLRKIFEADGQMKTLHKSVTALINKFGKSANATQALYKLKG
jgi:hypothetical protein